MGFVLIKFGRGEQNDVIIDRKEVSEEHCEIFVDVEGNAFLTDLNSEYGTFVNGAQVFDSVELKYTDKIHLANIINIDWVQYVEEQKKNIFSIGSSPDNRMVIQNDSVDPLHAELVKDTKGNIILNDLGSRLGTFVNGSRITQAVFLKENDVVQVGNCVVEWESVLSGQKKTAQMSGIPADVTVKTEGKTPPLQKEITTQVPPKKSFLSEYKDIIAIWAIDIVLLYLFSLLI